MALLAVAVLATWYAFDKRDEANASAGAAKQALALVRQEKDRADGELKKAQVSQSLLLADLAQQQSTAGANSTAILLALEALPDAGAGIARPYVPDAELALDVATRVCVNSVSSPATERRPEAAFSPDGKRIVTSSFDSARLWSADGAPIGERFRATRPVWQRHTRCQSALVSMGRASSP